MEEFDPQKAYSYSVREAARYINKGIVTKEALYSFGFPANKRPELEEELKKPIEDKKMWNWASRRDTEEAYQEYLDIYDVPEDRGYRGEYVFDAQMALRHLRELAIKLREELFDTMTKQPWLFPFTVMRHLIKGADEDTREAANDRDDIVSKFVAKGMKIKFEEIKERGIIPNTWTQATILKDDYGLPQVKMDELGDFPIEGRTDIYFLGVPRGGKSSVLAGLIYEMYRKGAVTYEPQFNHNMIDKSHPYYKGLLKSVEMNKFPVSTAKDSITFMKIQLNHNNRRNHLTFLEIAGEDFRTIADGHSVGADVWKSLGASQCLQSKNRKFLAFIIDYSIARGDVRTDSDDWTDRDQALTLEDALIVLGNDGPNPKKSSIGSTLSKVDTVAVIVTKSDLMGSDLTSEQKTDLAMVYLKEKFPNFMTNLSEACKIHGINSAMNHKPYVMTFSLGTLKIGNTYLYDPTDAANLMEFISRTTSGVRTGNRGFLGRIFN